MNIPFIFFPFKEDATSYPEKRKKKKKMLLGDPNLSFSVAFFRIFKMFF